MEQQEIFDIVSRHLLTQMQVSRPVGQTEGCAYRGGDGLKCAVGILITDEEYRPEMDTGQFVDGPADTTVNSLFVRNLLPERLRPHMVFLEELQSIHDTYHPHCWFDQLAGFAERHNLEFRHAH